MWGERSHRIERRRTTDKRDKVEGKGNQDKITKVIRWGV